MSTVHTPPVETTAGSTPVARGPLRPGYAVAGVSLVAAAVGAAVSYDTGLWVVVVFAVLPDLALVLGIGGAHQPGQLPRRAVPAYNLLHSPVVPALLLVAAVAGLGAYWAVAAITWAAHIAIDRGVGYGLRTRDGWQRG